MNMKYRKPSVVQYSREDVVDMMGPVKAQYQIDPGSPDQDGPPREDVGVIRMESDIQDQVPHMYVAERNVDEKSVS